MNQTTLSDVKWTVFIILPAFSSLYFVVDLFWELPLTKEVCGVIAIITLLLGVVLRSASNRYDGRMLVSKTAHGTTLYSLELKTDPSRFEFMDRVIFAVSQETEDEAL